MTGLKEDIGLKGETGLFPQSAEYNQGLTSEKPQTSTSSISESALTSAAIDNWTDLNSMEIEHTSQTGKVLIIFNAVNYSLTPSEGIYFIISKDGSRIDESMAYEWHALANAYTTTNLMYIDETAEKNTYKIQWKGDSAAITKSVTNRSMVIIDI
jgi:acetaldehyde dehydrogenase (acetylating)